MVATIGSVWDSGAPSHAINNKAVTGQHQAIYFLNKEAGSVVIYLGQKSASGHHYAEHNIVRAAFFLEMGRFCYAAETLGKNHAARRRHVIAAERCRTDFYYPLLSVQPAGNLADRKAFRRYHLHPPGFCCLSKRPRSQTTRWIAFILALG